MVKSFVARVETEALAGISHGRRAEELGLIHSFRNGVAAVEALGAVTLAAGIGNRNSLVAGVGGGVLAAALFADRVLAGFEVALDHNPVSE